MKLQEKKKDQKSIVILQPAETSPEGDNYSRAIEEMKTTELSVILGKTFIVKF